jgi:Spy/CpxP family protein refolding chaperone
VTAARGNFTRQAVFFHFIQLAKKPLFSPEGGFFTLWFFLAQCLQKSTQPAVAIIPLAVFNSISSLIFFHPTPVMKKTLMLLAALALTTAGTTFAQTAPAAGTAKMKIKGGKDHDKDKFTPEQKADKGAAKMAKELGLAPDQEARVEKILLARNQETQALKSKTGTDRKAAHDSMKALRDRYDGQLKAALTAEQFTKYQQLRAEHKGHGGHRGGPQDGKVKVKSKA